MLSATAPSGAFVFGKECYTPAMNATRGDMGNIAGQILEQEKARAGKGHATVIALSGDLGAGKTTLVQEMARHLGIGQDLQSPTFVIYKIYKTDTDSFPWKNLIHGDMYRLENADEIRLLGWDQLISDPENLVCIEWPEKVMEAIPEWAARVTLRHENGETRSVEIR